MKKKEYLKLKGWCWNLGAIAIVIGLALAIATFGERILTAAGLRNGISLLILLFAFFVISKVASVLYKIKWKNDFVLFWVISADMITVSTLGLNIAEDYVKSHPTTSWIFTFFACLLMLAAQVFLLERMPSKDNKAMTEVDSTLKSEQKPVLPTENGKLDREE